jgi:uracil-DNA glycosylase
MFTRSQVEALQTTLEADLLLFLPELVVAVGSSCSSSHGF